MNPISGIMMPDRNWDFQAASYSWVFCTSNWSIERSSPPKAFITE